MSTALQSIIDEFENYDDNDISSAILKDFASLVSIAARAEGYAEGLSQGIDRLREQHAALERRTLAILETLAASRPELIEATEFDHES